MSNLTERNYHCKDEEVPVIAQYVAFSLERDLTNFTSFSPMFDQVYLDSFKAKTASVMELVAPQNELALQKVITKRLYDTMEGLIEPLRRLEVYLSLAGSELTVAPDDFGISALRKSIHRSDAEGVMKKLQTLEQLLTANEAVLTTKGLTPEQSAVFGDAIDSINADNQRQYEMMSNRKTLVRENRALLNELYEQIMQIMQVGKALYADSDPVKADEYTFTQVVKKVRLPKAEEAAE